MLLRNSARAERGRSASGYFHRGVSTTTTTITSHAGLCRWWESQRKIPVGLRFSLKLCYTQLPQEAKKGRPVVATATLTSSPQKTTNCTHLAESKHTRSCSQANYNGIQACVHQHTNNHKSFTQYLLS